MVFLLVPLGLIFGFAGNSDQSHRLGAIYLHCVKYAVYVRQIQSRCFFTLIRRIQIIQTYQRQNDFTGVERNSVDKYVGNYLISTLRPILDK